MYNYIIVGAGLFGSVFTYEATKRGKKCLVLEKRDNIGGNVCTETIEGICVHKYGPHIFHTNNGKVWKYINRFAKFNRYTHTPVANFQGEIYNLPFNMNTFNRMWGLITPEEAKAKIQKQRALFNTNNPRNLEEAALNLVGKDIYEKLIKGYTEKQWGRACNELPAFIIERLPVRFTYDNNYFSDSYQGIPIGGYTQIIKKLLKGADIETGVDYLADKERFDAPSEKVIYTGAIDAYFDYRFGELAYRSIKLETEILHTPNYQGCAVMNYNDKKTPYTRVIEHKHFEFGTQPVTVVSREYPYKWKRGGEPFYPINDSANQALYDRYLELAKNENNVIFGGRLGEYKYYDMDCVIEKALELAEKELG